jgi:hypothetical protein
MKILKCSICVACVGCGGAPHTSLSTCTREVSDVLWVYLCSTGYGVVVYWYQSIFTVDAWSVQNAACECICVVLGAVVPTPICTISTCITKSKMSFSFEYICVVLGMVVLRPVFGTIAINIHSGHTWSFWSVVLLCTSGCGGTNTLAQYHNVIRYRMHTKGFWCTCLYCVWWY